MDFNKVCRRLYDSFEEISDPEKVVDDAINRLMGVVLRSEMVDLANSQINPDLIDPDSERFAALRDSVGDGYALAAINLGYLQFCQNRFCRLFSGPGLLDQGLVGLIVSCAETDSELLLDLASKLETKYSPALEQKVAAVFMNTLSLYKLRIVWLKSEFAKSN